MILSCAFIFLILISAYNVVMADMVLFWSTQKAIECVCVSGHFVRKGFRIIAMHGYKTVYINMNFFDCWLAIQLCWKLNFNLNFRNVSLKIVFTQKVLLKGTQYNLLFSFERSNQKVVGWNFSWTHWDF